VSLQQITIFLNGNEDAIRRRVRRMLDEAGFTELEFQMKAAIAEWTWDGFSHLELSKIASHLAGGGSFCCRHNAGMRAWVTHDRRKRDRLAEFAHEAMGCRSERQSAEQWHTWSAHYMAKFLDSLGGR
jgi:hypothetical protein